MPINSHVLVVGGAGFIGSHMVLSLQKAGFIPIVLDNLLKGHRDAVCNAALIVGDVRNRLLLKEIFLRYPIFAVMHFGSFIEVSESCDKPNDYYQNNVVGTLELLDAMIAHQVSNIIFSSSAAVYGSPSVTPIDECHPLSPISPYGRSKWMVEAIIQDYAKSYDMQFTIFRYFNAAGADSQGRIGERHHPESHLIPRILQVAKTKQGKVMVFGKNYETRDGTCIRDYVHVEDICHAHLLALQKMKKERMTAIYNLGTEKGFSVYEVIEAATKVTGVMIPYEIRPPRLGDPAILVADATKAKAELKWQPMFTSLNKMLQHAWQFLQMNSDLKKIG